jgi:hypothetical protein
MNYTVPAPRGAHGLNLWSKGGPGTLGRRLADLLLLTRLSPR